MSEQNIDTRNLGHTIWNFKYHMFFTPLSDLKSMSNNVSGKTTVCKAVVLEKTLASKTFVHANITTSIV